MKNKKLLFALVPVIVIVLVLIAGMIYLTINKSPENIFKKSIQTAFEMAESKQEKYQTVKGTMNISGNIESDNENAKIVNEYLEKLNLGINMEADISNFVINGNIKVTNDVIGVTNDVIDVTNDNKNVIDVTMILQDEKGYLYFKDWLDKYLELPEDVLEYSDIIELQNKIKTLNINNLLKSVEQELINVISKQKLTRGKTTIILDGKETQVTASTLDLKGTSIKTFIYDFAQNLKQNQDFQNALGDYQQDVVLMLEQVNLEESGLNEDAEMVFTIYTKGLLNEFVGVTARAIDNYSKETVALDILKHNDGKFEISNYAIHDSEREDKINLLIEDKKESKDKGTATITMSVEDEKFVVVCNYENQENKTIFEVTTEIKGVKFIISGNCEGNDKNAKGDLTLSFDVPGTAKVNLKCNYALELGVQVQKTDVQNSVLIDEISEEDQEELIRNMQKSPLGILVNNAIAILDAADNSNSLNNLNNEPEVTYDGHTVRYDVPDGFKMSEYSSEDMKMYTDENYNSAYVYIQEDKINTYLDDLDDEYILTSEYYKDQNISEVKTYPINGKEYKYRTITYNDEYSSYVNLYFAYQIDDEYLYVVELETENGNISMENMNKFLDIENF